MKELSRAKKLINQNIYYQILNLELVRDCKHDFKPYGYGFKCNKCQHYTGQSEEINKHIKAHLGL